MRTHYVLIDLENVKPASFELLNHDHFRVIVFVGSHQAKVPVDFAGSLQRLGDKAEYIQITGNGPNALDFHIAYYVGRLATRNPNACFHIISKDTGFDPLIKHLRTQNISAQRAKAIEDIAPVKSANSKSNPERIDVVLARLGNPKATRPRRVTTLTSTVASLFPKPLSDNEVAELVAELARRGAITIHEGRVSYAT